MSDYEEKAEKLRLLAENRADKIGAALMQAADDLDALVRERDAAWNEALEAAAKWLDAEGFEGDYIRAIKRL